MSKIYKLTMKSSLKDPFLILWSLIIPIVGTVGLGFLVKTKDYPKIIGIGMIAASIIFYAFMTTAFVILGHRKRGVYNLLRVTPLSLGKYIFSTASAWMTISIICGYIVFFVGYFAFGYGYNPLGIILMLPMMIVACLTFIFLSFFVSSFCNNESHLSMVANLITMPLIFCSNAFYSVDKAPKVIKWLFMINPFQIFLNGLKGALDNNWGKYGISLGIFLGLVAITLILAIRTFKFSDK